MATSLEVRVVVKPFFLFVFGSRLIMINLDEFGLICAVNAEN